MAEHIELKSFSAKVGEKDVRYSIEEIKNGFIISKNYESLDKEGHTQYVCDKIYSKENPFEKGSENLYDIMKASLGEDSIP